MKVVNKEELKLLMKEFPDGGIVFAEYVPDVLESSLMVTDGNFGATDVIPNQGEVILWDWNIEEYNEDDLFVIFDNNDILQMIKTLTSGLKIDLSYKI